MHLNPGLALFWTEKLIALAVFLQTLELLSISQSYGPRGTWAWSTLRDEFGGFPAPIRSILDAMFREDRFRILLAAQLVLAVWAGSVPLPGIFTVLFVTNLLVLVRCRGTFNGGSDFMTQVVLTGTAIGSLAPNSIRIREAALGYIAIQVCASYLVSGWIKIRRSSWRSGHALGGFLKTAVYESPGIMKPMLEIQTFASVVSWMVIGFELSFPLALLNSRLALGYISLGVLFHLAICYAFGLNRFVFAWVSTYPALLWCSQLHR